MIRIRKKDRLEIVNGFLRGEHRCVHPCTSKRYRPAVISSIVALTALIFSLCLVAIGYITSFQLSYHQQLSKEKPYLSLSPENSFVYASYSSKLLTLIESTTHLNNTPHKIHSLEIKIYNGIFTYRNTSMSYPSTPISESDHRLLQRARKSNGIPICQHWFKNSGFFPVNYDCTFRLVRTIPINMDVGSSSTSGINYLDARHVSTPTLLASTGLFILIQILFLACACCCSCFSSCTGYALAVQKTKESKSDPYRSFDPQLQSILQAANPQPQQPRAGHL